MKVNAKNSTPNSIAKLERLGRYTLLQAQGYQRCDTPIDLLIHSIRRKRIDISNTSAKAEIDGLVRAGIFEDDGPNQIASVKFTQEKADKGEPEMTIITVTVLL